MPIWNRDVECLPQGKLQALQLKRLRDVVARCARSVPLYANRLKEAGVAAEKLRALDDLRRIPFTTTADLEAAWPLGLTAVPQDAIACAYGVATGGGRHCIAAYTKKDLLLWEDIAARLLSMTGVTKESVVQVAFGQGLLAESFGLHQGVERIGARLMPASLGDKRRQIKLLRDMGATHLACTPRYALEVIEAAHALGVRLGRTKLQAGILGGELWSESTRQAIESGLGTPTFDHYGPAEILPAGIAAECHVRDGLHLFQDHIIAEIVNPASGEPLPDGATGELVVTTLTLEAAPVLRYRTGDLTSITRHRCDCGRTFARMARIAERPGRALTIAGLRIFPAQIEQALKEGAGMLPNYQARCDLKNVVEDLEIRIEVTESLLSDAMKNLRGLQMAVREHFLRVLSLNVKVTFVEPGALPPAATPEERVIYAG